MLKLFLLTLSIVVISFALLGVKILISKKGKFPNTHVGGNKALNKRGVYCVQTQDYMEYNNIKTNSQHRKLNKQNK